MIDYRRDIDGLRALALLFVLGYHVTPSIFPNGYLGVDVFFVISGYVISLSLKNELVLTGRISIIAFYNRRARRLVPPLGIVLIASLVPALIFLSPNELIAFSKSLIATTFFVSNIFFWRESGYFDVQSQFRPLLHTWSLSLEEQFYLFFPFLFLAIARSGRKARILIFLILFFSSFVLYLNFLLVKPMAVFYLLPFRIWEFLMGATAVLLFEKGTLFKKKTSNDALAFLGVFLMLFGVLNESISPIYILITAIFGSFSIIVSDGRIIKKLLSHRFLVFIGKISYGTYLWHFPVVVFLKHVLDSSSLSFIALSLSISFLLGILSYFLIEIPSRTLKLQNYHKLGGG